MLILILAEEIPVLVDGLATTLTVQDDQRLHGCYSTHFPTNSTSCSKVCGKVKGYQKGTMNAFNFISICIRTWKINFYEPPTLSRSLDGVRVNITSGNPRKHVWTYAVGESDNFKPYRQLNCPCASIQDQIHLHMLEITTIVSLVMLIEVNIPKYIMMTHYGMEQAVYLKTVVVMMI